MYGWIFKRVGWKFFTAGAATAYFGGGLIRPALVSAVKTGLAAKDAAAGVVNQARTEATNLFTEASHLRSSEGAASNIVQELRQLREEVASLKAHVAGRPS